MGPGSAVLPLLNGVSRLWNERASEPPKLDLLSMLAHGEATWDMPPREFMGTVALLIVVGNDTTRNTMSAGLLALHRHPDQWQTLRENPALLPGLVQETIRWQTPVIHMRRTAREDAELGGQRIRAGDKVVMWYVSGNRDEEVIDDPEGFVIDPPRPRHHLSFGSGVHRCVGDRVAELQLQILWEEILHRGLEIDVVGAPVRPYPNFLRGIKSLTVRIAG